MSRKLLPAAFILIASIFFPLGVQAQDMTFSEEETGTEEKPPPEEEGATKEGKGVLEELTAEGEGEEKEEVKAEESVKKPSAKIEIYALQRIWAKKAGRFELYPAFGTSMADPYVGHLQISLTANYYITEVLGVGIHGAWYGNTTRGTSMNTAKSLNFHVSRSFGLVIPINEYAGTINVNFTYVFLYGKFSVFRKYIFNWDAFLEGGVGAIWTRPIPVVDVEYRTFSYKPKVDIRLGVGLRIFVTRSLAIATDLQVYMFPEKLENRDTRILDLNCENVAQGMPCRQNPDSWLESGNTFTFNWMWNFGFCLYFPFKVKYRYEK
jgi:outer membrane beta-barrel protein